MHLISSRYYELKLAAEAEYVYAVLKNQPETLVEACILEGITDSTIFATAWYNIHHRSVNNMSISLLTDECMSVTDAILILRAVWAYPNVAVIPDIMELAKYNHFTRHMVKNHIEILESDEELAMLAAILLKEKVAKGLLDK